MQHLNKITIKGFKSIRELNDFELKNLNIIIGANGAGKSNLISFFKMLHKFMRNELNRYIRDSGNVNNVLYGGPKITERMEFEMMFGDRGFKFNLVPTPNEECAIENEARYYKDSQSKWWLLGDNAQGKSELVQEIERKSPHAKYSKPIYEAILSWRIYHFHDTGSTAKMRLSDIVENNLILEHDAGNIAAFLKRLKDEEDESYQNIVRTIRLAIPFFDDFYLHPRKDGEHHNIKLEWKQKGSDFPFQPYHFSDGSMRFICLVVALLQPNPPPTIIIDEPEIGLHPSAIGLLAELVHVASRKTQIIMATQSPELINYFAIDDIITATRKNNASHFERLNENDYSEWLENYSVGELWCKNIIQGDISYE
jgi:predicted ATPase